MNCLENFPAFGGRDAWDDSGADPAALDLDNPANSHINVVLWSWCSISGHDAQRYVDNM